MIRWNPRFAGMQCLGEEVEKCQDRKKLHEMWNHMTIMIDSFPHPAPLLQVANTCIFHNIRSNYYLGQIHTPQFSSHLGRSNRPLSTWFMEVYKVLPFVACRKKGNCRSSLKGTQSVTARNLANGFSFTASSSKRTSRASNLDIEMPLTKLL